MGGVGGGSLEQPRQWLGACEPASSWECRAAQSRQARPEEAQEPSRGSHPSHRQGEHFEQAERQAVRKSTSEPIPPIEASDALRDIFCSVSRGSRAWVRPIRGLNGLESREAASAASMLLVRARAEARVSVGVRVGDRVGFRVGVRVRVRVRAWARVRRPQCSCARPPAPLPPASRCA